MTEQDIIQDLDSCFRGACSKCSRFTTNADQCRNKLIQDAAAIIKMQNDALSGLKAALDQAEEKLQWLPKKHQTLTENQFVAHLNEVIANCYLVDWEDDEYCDYAYVRMLRTILEFSAHLPSKYRVVIEAVRSAPQLVLVKE